MNPGATAADPAASDGSAARRPRVGVLALQGDFAAHREMLEELGAEVVEVRVPGDLEGLDGLVIPGGESTTMTLGIERERLAEPLRAVAASGAPVFGTCAGMIMLDSEHLGVMDTTCRRNAFGRQVDSFEAAVAIDDIPGDDFHAVFIRAPWVEEVGANVTVLGRVTSGPAAGRIVAVRQGNLLATAFHPELTGDLRVHRYFVEIVRQS